MDESGKPPGRRSLRPAEIVTRRAAARTIVAAGLGMAAAPTQAQSQTPSRTTDRDDGPNADPPGQGRQLRDSDPNDSPGRGRPSISDSDSGPNSDPPGTGRGGRGERTGVTDTDSGASADPPGGGQGLRAPTPFPGPRAR